MHDAKNFYGRIDELLAEQAEEVAKANVHLDRAGEIQAQIRRLLDTHDALGKAAANE